MVPWPGCELPVMSVLRGRTEGTLELKRWFSTVCTALGKAFRDDGDPLFVCLFLFFSFFIVQPSIWGVRSGHPSRIPRDS